MQFSKLISLVFLLVIAPLVQGTRLVTIDGSITEIVVALGAENQIVGVDTTSTYPEEMKQLPQVGYMRALSAEGILSLKPDLILATQDAGPQDVLDQLTAANVNILLLENRYDFPGVTEKIRRVATAIGRVEEGNRLVSQLEQRFENIQATIATTVGAAGEKPKVLFAMSAGKRGMMVAGTHTRAGAIIDLAGGLNVFSEFEGYKPLTPESLISKNPDIILVFHSPTGVEDLAENPALAATNAAKNQHIYNVDKMDLLVFGPRINTAIEDLYQLMNLGLGQH